MSKKNRLPFDTRGGVIALRRRMYESDAFLSLNGTQQALIPHLQMHWRNERPVSYGVREVEKKLHCSRGTAAKAFHALMDRGFIVCTEESHFHSKCGSKTREWLLTWMPYEGKPPANLWKKWTP